MNALPLNNIPQPIDTIPNDVNLRTIVSLCKPYADIQIGNIPLETFRVDTSMCWINIEWEWNETGVIKIQMLQATIQNVFTCNTTLVGIYVRCCDLSTSQETGIPVLRISHSSTVKSLVRFTVNHGYFVLSWEIFLVSLVEIIWHSCAAYIYLDFLEKHIQHLIVSWLLQWDRGCAVTWQTFQRKLIFVNTRRNEQLTKISIHHTSLTCKAVFLPYALEMKTNSWSSLTTLATHRAVFNPYFSQLDKTQPGCTCRNRVSPVFAVRFNVRKKSDPCLFLVGSLESIIFNWKIVVWAHTLSPSM